MKFAPIFIAVLLFAVQRIEAQQVLDQEQTQYYGGLSARTLPGYAVGQSFTAGLTGTMTEIDMGFFNNIAGNGRLIIFTGAGPEGTILETLPVTVTSITGTGVSWNDWTVDVPVVAGSQYTFMFTPNAATIPDPYGVCIGSEDSYAGGNLYLQDSSGAVTKFFQSVFRTYVDVNSSPSPTPAPLPGPAPAGTSYLGLASTGSGAGLISGEMRVHIARGNNFSATLNFGGQLYPFAGKIDSYGIYLSYDPASKIGVYLSYTGSSSLTGGVFNGARTIGYYGGEIQKSGARHFWYDFTIGPGELLRQGWAPEGAGYGFMYVSQDGKVLLDGQLPDGSSFQAHSAITSGSSIPIYLNKGDGANSGIAGILVFNDIPNVSDCAGTIYWARPSSVDYPVGFETATTFTAAAYTPAISGLNGDTVHFAATGADLAGTTYSEDIPVHVHDGLATGAAHGVKLSIDSAGNTFHGVFQDPFFPAKREFNGVLLPKSRTGAGLFKANGLTDTVTIRY